MNDATESPRVLIVWTPEGKSIRISDGRIAKVGPDSSLTVYVDGSVSARAVAAFAPGKWTSWGWGPKTPTIYSSTPMFPQIASTPSPEYRVIHLDNGPDVRVDQRGRTHPDDQDVLARFWRQRAAKNFERTTQTDTEDIA